MGSLLFANEDSQITNYVPNIVKVKINCGSAENVQGWTKSWAESRLNPVFWVLHKSDLQSVKLNQH